VTSPGLSSRFNLSMNIVRLYRTWLTTRAYTLFRLSPHAYLLKRRFDSTTNTINFAQRLCGAPFMRPANPPQVFRGEAFKSWRLPRAWHGRVHGLRGSNPQVLPPTRIKFCGSQTFYCEHGLGTGIPGSPALRVTRYLLRRV
jgi:hypothetical protein